MNFFAPALIFCGAAAFSQAPQVPHKMQFAGLTLSIRDDARREIQKDVDALTLHPKYFNIKVERAKTYFPIIEKIFDEERLPQDFKYLALQESALVPDAVSSSNAVGFWQFKEFTAHEVGLRVDAEVDERMNIASASRGAARYLKQCNHYFNNWVYALQSYQMGAGGVMRSVGDQDLGGRHMEITSDTYWYVKKFIAHKVAFENATSGKGVVELTRLNSAGGKTLLEISQTTSVEEQKIRDFNKWLKTDRIPIDKEYVVLIPNGEGSVDFGVLAIATSKATPLPESTNPAVVKEEEKLKINGIPVIRARRGETASIIAARGNIGVSAFLSNNEIEIDNPLREGDLYFLGKKKKRAEQELYTIKSGESLWMISQRFGVQQKSLLKYNRLNKDAKLAAGLTLFLNSKKPAVPETETERENVIVTLDEDNSFNWDQPVSKKNVAIVVPETKSDSETMPSTEAATLLLGDITPGTSNVPAISIHEVKSSDTLYSVARQYGVTIKELMEWNEKKEFTLSVGEKLKIHAR